MGQGTSSSGRSQRGRGRSNSAMHMNGNWTAEGAPLKMNRRRSFSVLRAHKSSSKINGSTEFSTTFSMNDSALAHQRLNVNAATEEELMTLPGITRQVAMNLVDHRTAIGGFKKVEDLALVSGVGAAKLDLIRPEICLGGRRWPTGGHSGRNSSVYGGGLSRNASFDQPWSQPCSAEQTPRSQPRRKQVCVDINSANVFTLMSLSGVGQTLAANIVHHREKKGPFRNVNEVAKVKGMHPRILAQLSPYLLAGSDLQTPFPAPSPSPTPSIQRHHKGLPRVNENGVSDGQRELFDLLSEKSVRPTGVEPFAFERDGQTALRVATWNLTEMGTEKASNLGVLEVVACTLLEQGISLVALQEVGGSDILEKVCAELNDPSFARVRDLGVSGRWMSVCSEPPRNSSLHNRRNTHHLGFLYDASRGIELVSSGPVDATLADRNNEAGDCGAFRANFMVDGRLELSLLNVHPRLPDENGCVPSRIHELTLQTSFLETLNGNCIDGDSLIVLGDFSVLCCKNYGDILKERGLNRVIPVGCKTNSDYIGNKQHYFDNIWMTKQIEGVFTGKWCTVKTGLTHLAIPRGWQWGGVASEHCPIWAEFFVPEPPEQNHEDTLEDSLESVLTINGGL